MPNQPYQSRNPSPAAVRPVQPNPNAGPHYYSIYDTESGREIERNIDYGTALAAAARITAQNATRPT
jgi:hypothetical protein